MRNAHDRNPCYFTIHYVYCFTTFTIHSVCIISRIILKPILCITLCFTPPKFVLQHWARNLIYPSLRLSHTSQSHLLSHSHTFQSHHLSHSHTSERMVHACKILSQRYSNNFSTHPTPFFLPLPLYLFLSLLPLSQLSLSLKLCRHTHHTTLETP